MELEGTYSVTLTVVSGSKSSSQTKDVTVSEAPVGSPTAEILSNDEEDCLYEEIDNTRDIILWLCYGQRPGYDKIQDTRDIMLDAYDTEAGGEDHTLLSTTGT